MINDCSIRVFDNFVFVICIVLINNNNYYAYEGLT